MCLFKFFHLTKTFEEDIQREKDCIAVKTVSKRKPKRYIFVTFERVKNRVDLCGTI